MKSIAPRTHRHGRNPFVGLSFHALSAAARPRLPRETLAWVRDFGIDAGLRKAPPHEQTFPDSRNTR